MKWFTTNLTELVMPEKKIIAVIGATGAQGGGVVRAIQADKGGQFVARAITRNPNSEKAQALRNSGVEVVAGDADKPETLGPGVPRCLRRLSRHQFLGALLRRAGGDPGPQHGGGGQGRRHPARRLVHPGRHPQMGAAERQPDAHPAGQVQGAPLRRQG